MISAGSICYRFFLIQRKYRTIRRSDIKNMNIITYNPIAYYGGWGIRFGNKGKAYSVRGNQGLLIELTGDLEMTLNHLLLIENKAVTF